MFGITPYRRMNELDPFRMMDSFFSNERHGFRVDIEDAGNELILSAELPGFEKEDISIDLDNDRLTISAERRMESKEKNYLRCERSYSSYRRSFGLDGIDAEKIEAAYRNGVLQLTLPKLTPAKNEPRRIEIQ